LLAAFGGGNQDIENGSWQRKKRRLPGHSKAFLEVAKLVKRLILLDHFPLHP
jgi:hypothetical protein